MDVSVPGGEVMVVGFANGSFALWDLDNEKLIKLVEGGKRGSPHSGMSPGTQSQDTSSHKTTRVVKQLGWYVEFESRVPQRR